jgi:hypothetical protein
MSKRRIQKPRDKPKIGFISKRLYSALLFLGWLGSRRNESEIKIPFLMIIVYFEGKLRKSRIYKLQHTGDFLFYV